MSRPLRQRRPPWPLLLSLAGAGLLLGITNPSPQEFEAFAAERLADLAVQELCHGDGLPQQLQLLLPNCEALLRSQRTWFGQVALRQSQRLNGGLLSLYLTELGGQRFGDSWQLPRYGVITLAAAGQFLVVHTREQRAPRP